MNTKQDFAEQLRIMGFSPLVAYAIAFSDSGDMIPMNDKDRALFMTFGIYISDCLKRFKEHDAMKGSEILNHLAAGKIITRYENGFYTKLTTDEVFTHIRTGRALTVLHKFDESQNLEPMPHPDAVVAMGEFERAIIQYNNTPNTVDRTTVASQLSAASKKLQRWLIRAPAKADKYANADNGLYGPEYEDQK